MPGGGEPGQLIRHNDDDRRALSTRVAVVSLVGQHVALVLRRQWVSWVVTTGMLVAGVAISGFLWWSFLAIIGYVGWLMFGPHPQLSSAAPITAPTAPGANPPPSLPSIRWFDVTPDDQDTRAAIYALLPDGGESLFNSYMPMGTQQSEAAVRSLLRALHQQGQLPLSGVLIAYAADIRFPVALIPLPDSAVSLAALPPAPARLIADSDDGPWLLVALGTAAPPVHRPPATGTTDLHLALPETTPADAGAAAVPVGVASFEDMYADMLAAAPRRPVAEQEAAALRRRAATEAQASRGATSSSGARPRPGPRLGDFDDVTVGPGRAAHGPGNEEHGGQVVVAGRAPVLAQRTDAPPLRVSAPARPMSRDVLLGYARDSGVPVTIPLMAISGILAVAFGIPRTGKTTSLEGLVQRTSLAGLPWGIAYDTKPEWYGLRCAENPGDAVPLIVLGDGAKADLQLPVAGLAPTLFDLPERADEKRERLEQLTSTLTVWQQSIEWLMEHHHGWICDLSSERVGLAGSSRVLTAVFLAVIRSARRHRQPFGILIDEAQNALPQGKLGKQLWEAAMGITRTAPSLGVTTFLAAHRPTDIDKDLIAPARLRILHRVDLPLDVKAYADMLPWPLDMVQRTVDSLQPGEAIVYGPNLLNTGNDPIVVRMMPSTTFHVGYTPAIGVSPPVEPPRIPIDPGVLTAAARIPGVWLARAACPAAPSPAVATTPAPVLTSTPASGTSYGVTTSSLEQLDPNRWPEKVRGHIAAMLRNDAARSLVLRAARVGVTLPLVEPGEEAPPEKVMRLALLSKLEMLPLIAAAVQAGLEYKPLARLLFGIPEPGRAAQEIRDAVEGWKQQRGASRVTTNGHLVEAIDE